MKGYKILPFISFKRRSEVGRHKPSLKESPATPWPINKTSVSYYLIFLPSFNLIQCNIPPLVNIFEAALDPRHLTTITHHIMFRLSQWINILIIEWKKQSITQGNNFKTLIFQNNKISIQCRVKHYFEKIYMYLHGFLQTGA